MQPEGFLKEAFVDVDGTIAKTYGECKAGMDISYQGIWGYAPLIVSLANTKEVLYLVNRPGNAVSHSGSVEWIDRAVELVSQVAGSVTIGRNVILAGQAGIFPRAYTPSPVCGPARAALMTGRRDEGAYRAHAERARAGASRDALLARNIGHLS
mgnify:CR=1 FL=1